MLVGPNELATRLHSRLIRRVCCFPMPAARPARRDRPDAPSDIVLTFPSLAVHRTRTATAKKREGTLLEAATFPGTKKGTVRSVPFPLTHKCNPCARNRPLTIQGVTEPGIGADGKWLPKMENLLPFGRTPSQKGSGWERPMVSEKTRAW